MRLHDRTVFVAGATSGIGQGLAEAFHRAGSTVIVSGRRRARLETLVAANPGMAAIELDIADPASIAAAAARLAADHPALDVLVNNAGIMPFDDAAGPIDDAAAGRLVATNLLGPIRMTAALIGGLRRRPEAAVIYNTSVLAFTPLAAAALYSATKAALHSYVLSQRFALRDTTVRVREIAPPWVDTDLVGRSDDPRAMPLDAFVGAAMQALAGDDDEIVVEAARQMRDNPGPAEYAWVEAFNAHMASQPIPH